MVVVPIVPLPHVYGPVGAGAVPVAAGKVPDRGAPVLMNGGTGPVPEGYEVGGVPGAVPGAVGPVV
jgi:hypothetical protein